MLLNLMAKPFFLFIIFSSFNKNRHAKCTKAILAIMVLDCWILDLIGSRVLSTFGGVVIGPLMKISNLHISQLFR